jgi:glycosyltransferase involved in cell wall biosynthesis
MKVCFVTGHYAPFVGGIETHVERIAFHLATRGDDVTVLTQTDDPSWPSEETIDGVHVRRFAVPLPIRDFAVSPALFRALSAGRGGWDIVHAHGYGGVAPLLAAMARARPLVFTPHYHGTGHSTFRKALHVPYRHIGSRLVAMTSAVICVSEAERSLFLSHFPRAAAKTSVIPNGVDLDRLLAATPMPTERRVVVSAGRLETYKHVELTIRAFAHLSDEYQLIVTGDGPDRARLEGITAELGLRGKVSFLGRIDVEDLHRWFTSAKVYVSMSTNEAMPVTILEMLACGARVVVSDIPAHRDLKARFGEWLTVVPLATPAPELAAKIEAAAKADSVTPPAVPTWTDVAEATRGVYQRVLDVV